MELVSRCEEWVILDFVVESKDGSFVMDAGLVIGAFPMSS
jgi:hypothetical protein